MDTRDTPQIDAAQAAAYARLLERLFGERPDEAQEKPKNTRMVKTANFLDLTNVESAPSDEGSGQ